MKLDYMQRIQLGYSFFGDNIPEGVFEVTLAHHTGCKATIGKPCSCTPDIEVRVDGRKFTIDEEGVMNEKTDAR